jgi:DNA-directed RNA polymerase specialized sigma24 family protein
VHFVTSGPEQTVESASRGDPAAIEALLERHLPRLRAFVRLRVGAELRQRESASDIVQSACREVIANMGRYRYRGEDQFRRWLFTAALRKLADKVEHHRAAKHGSRTFRRAQIRLPLQSRRQNRCQGTTSMPSSSRRGSVSRLTMRARRTR